jgi:hypothetical protein
MKYFILLLSVAAMAVTGCNSSTDNSMNNNGMTNDVSGMTNGQTRTMPPN